MLEFITKCMDPNFSFQYIYYDIDGQFLYDFVLLPKDYD